MRSKGLLGVGACAAALLGATPASAHVVHVIEPGETLWSIAGASNFTTRALAAANGLPEDARVLAGATIQIPSEPEAAVALRGAGQVQQSGAPRPLGAYVVRPGDTLTAIAARSGVGVSTLAWMNGLDPSRLLLVGTPLKLPTGAPTPSPPAAPPNPRAVPSAPPHPTAEWVTPTEVGQVAAAHGVSPSLAAAVARQESGFNNALVSTANARGVMQILPGTWEFIQRRLVSSPLDPSSATANVHAGVAYLSQLLRDTGGDEAAATAAYYQGLSSLRRIGWLPDTRRYVADVMALRRLYGP
jgi:soluble lytic murein transglycosylase-like protein